MSTNKTQNGKKRKLQLFFLDFIQNRKIENFKKKNIDFEMNLKKI